MSKAYIGSDGVAKAIRACYIGVDGVARRVKKIYIGVDGVARLCWICSNFNLVNGDTLVTRDGMIFNVTEAVLPTLTAPTVSLYGDALLIYDESEFATEFDILVDGEVVRTVSAESE